jgi:hypothetical protein
MIDFTVEKQPNGDFNVFYHNVNQGNIMQDVRPKFLLLTPLTPSLFDDDDENTTRMVLEMEERGIKIMVADTGRELLFYGYAAKKEILDDLCTEFNISGLCVEYTAVYDQMISLELVYN